MKALSFTLPLLLFLATSAGAQVTTTTTTRPDAPDVQVVKITWRRVAHNPKLDDAPLIGNPEGALKAAVNTARINATLSAQPITTPKPPVLLSISPAQDAPPVMRPWSGFVYEFTVKNEGAKIIRKLFWEYAFTDAATGRTVGRRQYNSSVKIRPGMTAKLVVRSALPPIGIIQAGQAGRDMQEQPPEQMVIQKIKYEDGSIWQRSLK